MVHPSVGSTLHPTHSQTGMEAIPKPSLHRALESLMVNLDDELLRYRHSRTSQGPAPTPQKKLAFRPKGRPSPSLIHLKPAGVKRREDPAPSRGTSPTTPTVAPPMPPMPPTGTAIPGSSAQPVAITGNTLAPYQAMPQAYLESTAALLESTPPSFEANYPTAYYSDPNYYPDPDYHNEADYQISLAQRLSTPLGVGALLLLLIGSAGFGYLVTSPTAIDHLRNHAWMQRFQTTPSTPETDGMTPAPAAMGEVPTGLQGIGPDLSGQEFGSLDLDRVSRLPVDPSRSNPANPDAASPNSENPALGATGTETPGESARDGATDTSQRPTETASSSDRPQPTQEVRPRGTLRTEPVVPLSPSRPAPTTVSPSAVSPGSGRPPAPSQPTVQSSAPAAPPTRLAPPAPVAPAPLPPPAAQPPQPLGTVTTVPTPAPTPVSPPPPLAPAARPNYYVVADYTGNQSLESARGVVGDAYVRDFQGGTKIQMGAFSQESSARDLAQRLQQQGIPTQIYQTP